MVGNGIYRTAYNSSEKAPFRVSFITMAFILFLFTQFAVQAGFIDPNCSLSELLGFEQQHETAKSAFNPIHSSSQHGTTLPIAEFLKETEVQEKSPISKDYHFYTSLSLIKSAFTSESEIPHLEFVRTLQNRPSRSLVIFHHSWKSYLI